MTKEEAKIQELRAALLAQKDWYERALNSMASHGEVSDGLMFQQPRVLNLVAKALEGIND